MKKRIVQDKNDIEFHYDRSNEFYKLMLDKNMVYSCAYFQKWDEDLDKAQENKLDLICRKLRLRPREKFLDIGCGWGSLVIWAAKNYGVEAYGITNSTSQFKLASERIEKEGLKSCCAVGLKDYRELHGQRIFDKVAKEAIRYSDNLNRDKEAEYIKNLSEKLKTNYVTPENIEYFPVWPHPEYAQKITDIHFPGHEATEVSLDEFMNHWLPTFEKDNVKVAVFPNKDWVFWVMEPADMLESLKEEISLYE